MKKNVSEKEKIVANGENTKKATTSKMMKTKSSKTKGKAKKPTSKKKKDVEDFTFEERAFASDKKKKVIRDNKKINIVPILVGVVCVLLVIGVVSLIKNDKFTFVETKKMETTIAKPTEKPTEKTTETVETTTKAPEKIEADITILKREMPCYDTDIYSEGAMYSYKKEVLDNIQKEIEDLQNDSAYETLINEGKRDIIAVNKMMLDNYLDDYNASNKKDYDNTTRKEYTNDIANGATEKKGGFYYSEYVAVSLFSEAKDKGFYYEIPSTFYKKVTIKKYAFDKMEIGAKGSISLPVGEDGELVATEVVKENDNTVSYKDKDGNVVRLTLVNKSDIEYALKNEETGAYIVAFYFNDSVSVLKNARVGHGKDMEYVAYNYLRYPTDITFEVYVKAEDIVNKTSTNDMLNGQWINSSKQVWDEKGFVTSIVYFE